MFEEQKKYVQGHEFILLENIDCVPSVGCRGTLKIAFRWIGECQQLSNVENHTEKGGQYLFPVGSMPLKEDFSWGASYLRTVGGKVDIVTQWAFW